jgi:transcriptional regulator with XRE-family HTH domain
MTPAEIKALRDAMRLEQARFAFLLGVHPITVSKWERGKASPPLWLLTLMLAFQRSPHLSTGDTRLDLMNRGPVYAIAKLLQALSHS